MKTFNQSIVSLSIHFRLKKIDHVKEKYQVNKTASFAPGTWEVAVVRRNATRPGSARVGGAGWPRQTRGTAGLEARRFRGDGGRGRGALTADSRPAGSAGEEGRAGKCPPPGFCGRVP